MTRRTRIPDRRRAGAALDARRGAEEIDVRASILAATERQLEGRRLEDLTVVDVIEDAQASRATFYMYFESKHAAVAALAEAVFAGIVEDVWRAWLSGDEPAEPNVLVDHWRETFVRWEQHRAVLVAAAQGWRSHASVYAGWGALWQSYVTDMREYIERAQAEGLAPPGQDAATIAAVLVWQHETVLYLSFSDEVPEFADRERLAKTMARIWLQAIYGVLPVAEEPPAT